jgi:hypothetical protein
MGINKQVGVQGFKARPGRDFIESNNLTFFVVIKNWCPCPSLINIFGQIMTNKLWRFNNRLGRLIGHKIS